jgi:ABC-type multidrug transport system ATPase subunit
MHAGRLLTAEAPEAIKGAFQGELLELRAADLRMARAALQDEPLAVHVLAMGDRLMVTVKQAEEATGPLRQALLQAGMAEVEINRTEPGLEEVFVQIIRREEG